MKTFIKTVPNKYCQICKKNGLILYFSLSDKFFNNSGRWNILYCKKCKISWIDPIPINSDTGKLYPANYRTNINNGKIKRIFGNIKDRIVASILCYKFGYQYSADSLGLWNLLSKITIVKDYIGRRISWVEFKKNGKLLDIGCGTGGFIEEMKKLGWNVTGIEIDKKAANIAKLRVGSEFIINRQLKESNLLEASYDVITLLHVFEHLSQPIDTLKICLKLLKPDGKIVINTPNINSLGHILFKKNWMPLEVPRHFFLYSPKGLRECIESVNLEVQEMWTSTYISNFVWNTSIIIKRRGNLTNGRLPEPLSLSHKATSLLFKIIETILNIFVPVGEEVILIAKKKC